MILFEGRVAFLLKRTTGEIGENWKLDPSSFLGSKPSSCCERVNGIRKGFSEVKRKNDGRTVVPLLQGFHTQHESAAASAPRLSGKHESSTSTTSPQSRQPKKCRRDQQELG
jgi:hypothetical protein